MSNNDDEFPLSELLRDIAIVKESEKYKKIQCVNPNIIQNRFDLWEGSGHFQVLQITYQSNERKYIAFRVDNNGICHLGLYMMEIEKRVLDAAIIFLNQVMNVFRFTFGQSLNIYPKLCKTTHWLLELPNSYEEFLQRFSRKTRYNRRREVRQLNEDYCCEIKHLEKEEISTELIGRLIERKSEQYGVENNVILTASWVLPVYSSISDAWVMYLNGKLAAMTFYSIMPNSSDAYFVSIAYEAEYKKYFVGNMLFYHSIRELIAKKIKRIYTGEAESDYKKNAHCIKNETCGGVLFLHYQN